MSPLEDLVTLLRAELCAERHRVACMREDIRLEREARQTDEEQIVELLAERDALREALNKICAIELDRYSHDWAEIEQAQDIARAALNKGGGDE